MSSFTKDVKRLLKEQEAEKKRKGLKGGGIKLNPKLKNTLNKLNPFKNDKFKKLSNHKDKEAVNQAVDSQPVLDSTTKETDEDYKVSVLAMEQFALQFLKNEKYTAIIDNEKYDIEHFMGTLYGIELTSPNLFMKMMQNKNIQKTYDKYKAKYPYKKEKKSGGADTQSAKVPSDKKGQIKYIQKAVGTKDDGQWGKKTDAKWEEWIVSDGVTKAIEKILGVTSADPEKETPQKNTTTPENKPETKPEVQKESLNRLGLRNLLETMTYFPSLLQEGETKASQGTVDVVVKHYAFAKYKDDDPSKFFMGISVSRIIVDGKNYLGKRIRINPGADLGTVKAMATQKADDRNAGINICRTGKNPRELVDLVMSKIPKAKFSDPARKKFKYKLEDDLYRALGKAAKKSIAEGPPAKPETETGDTSSKDGTKSPPKKKSRGKKSPPKRDNMGREGKMGEIAKNRGNAAAIAKMLGFKGNLAGVAKAVAKIKANMSAPISENRKLFETLVKYKII